MLSTLTGSLSSIRAKVSSFVGITDLTKTFTKYETSIVAANDKIDNLGQSISSVKDRLFQVDVTLHDFIQEAPAMIDIRKVVEKAVEKSVESTLNDYSFRDAFEDVSVNCSFSDDYGHVIEAMSTEVDNTSAIVSDMNGTVNVHTETLERIEMSLREMRGILNDLHVMRFEFMTMVGTLREMRGVLDDLNKAKDVTPEQQQQMVDVMLPRTWVKTEDNWKVVQ